MERTLALPIRTESGFSRGIGPGKDKTFCIFPVLDFCCGRSYGWSICRTGLFYCISIRFREQQFCRFLHGLCCSVSRGSSKAEWYDLAFGKTSTSASFLGTVLSGCICGRIDVQRSGKSVLLSEFLFQSIHIIGVIIYLYGISLESLFRDPYRLYIDFCHGTLLCMGKIAENRERFLY